MEDGKKGHRKYHVKGLGLVRRSAAGVFRQVPTWTTPIAVSLFLRLNFTQLQCKQCQQAFESKPDGEERKPEESESG